MSDHDSMSKNKQRLWLLSMLLIYLGIAIAGFAVAYVIKITLLKPQQTPSSAQTATQPTPFPIPAGWKSYTNADYNVSLSYPPTDAIKTSSYGFGVTSVTFSKGKTTDFQLLLLPKSIAQMVGQDFDTYYSMPDKTTKVIKNPLAQDNSTEKFTKIRNRSIEGNQALDYHSIASNAKPGSPYEIGTLIAIGDNLVLIATGEDNKKELEQILSTLN